MKRRTNQKAKKRRTERRKEVQIKQKSIETLIKEDWLNGLTPDRIAEKNNVDIIKVYKTLKTVGIDFPDNLLPKEEVEELIGKQDTVKAEVSITLPPFNFVPAEPETEGRKKRRFLSEDTKQKISEIYKKGEYTRDLIAKACDVSAATIDRINKKYLTDEEIKAAVRSSKHATHESEEKAIKAVRDAIWPMLPDSIIEDIISESVEEKKEIPAIDTTPKEKHLEPEFAINIIPNENDNEFIKVKSGSRYIEAGLIANRHAMPVSKFIFDDSLTPSELSSYTWQEEKIRGFINANIRFDDSLVPMASLKVYVTGLQAVLASLIKVCSEMKVGLVIMHHDPNSGRYNPQVVFGNTEEDCLPNEFYKCTEEAQEVFLYKTTFDELLSLDSIYHVVYNKYRILGPEEDRKEANAKKNILYGASYLVKSLEDAFAVLSKLGIESTRNGSYRTGIFLRDLNKNYRTNSYVGKTLWQMYENIDELQRGISNPTIGDVVSFNNR